MEWTSDCSIRHPSFQNGAREGYIPVLRGPHPGPRLPGFEDLIISVVSQVEFNNIFVGNPKVFICSNDLPKVRSLRS